MPSLVASCTRVILVAIPVFFLARLPGFEMRWIWYLSVFAVALQMAGNLLLLRRQFQRRLGPGGGRGAAGPEPEGRAPRVNV